VVQEIVQDGLSIESKAWNVAEDVRPQSHREAERAPSSEGEPSERPYLVR